MGRRATKSDTDGSVHKPGIRAFSRTHKMMVIEIKAKRAGKGLQKRTIAKLTYKNRYSDDRRQAAAQALVADMATALNRLEGVEFDAETAALIERHESEQVPIDEGARALLDHIRKRSGS